MLGRPGGALAAALLTLTAGLAACSSPDPQAAAAPTGDTVEVAVSVRDGKVHPEPRRVSVPEGGTVRLVVTSDVDDEVHVHAYEAEGVLEAGRPTTIEFVADQPGVFEVETHESGLELLQLEVR